MAIEKLTSKAWTDIAKVSSVTASGISFIDGIESASGNGLLTSLVSYYPMDTNANDSHGSNNGTVSGATLTTSSGGIISEGYDFVRADADNISASINLTSTTTFSVSFWFYCHNISDTQRIIERGTFGNDLSLQLFSSKLRGIVGRDGGGQQLTSSTATLSSNTRYHVVRTYNGSTSNIYINAGTPTTDSISTSIASGAQTIYWGGDPLSGNSEHYDGVIDELGFWGGRVLSASDASTLHNSGSGLAYGSFTS